MTPVKILISLFLIISVCSISAQDDLEALLMNEMGEEVEYEFGTFISNNVLNNHSTEMTNKNGIGFRISHKFGSLKSGPAAFYGFDNAISLFEVNYAPVDWWNIGLGRSTVNESMNAYTKFRIARQSTGAKVMPVSVAMLLVANCVTTQFEDENRNNQLAERFDYTSQLLIARKFGKNFSAQLTPTYIHRNLVKTKAELNDLVALGFGATYKIKQHFSVNAEYFWVQKHNTPSTEYFNPLSVGVCYQTSRHAFELFVTNSNGITETQFLANTTNDFLKGDVRIGFNIATVFTLKSKK
jgi:hypothetical protein